MLALTVKPGKRVLIGHEIFVHNAGAHNIRLALHAPPEFQILREELVEHGPRDRPKGGPSHAP